jgi:hypothetical protein
MAVTLALTWAGLWAVGSNFEQTQPVVSGIVRAEVLEAPNGTSARTLRAEFTAPTPANCTRFSAASLSRDDAGTPVDIPLGAGLNGSGFGGRYGAVFGTTPRPKQRLGFVVMLALPPDLPDGLYQLLYRSVYTCPLFGGFVVRRILFEAPPVPIWLGAH